MGEELATGSEKNKESKLVNLTPGRQQPPVTLAPPNRGLS